MVQGGAVRLRGPVHGRRGQGEARQRRTRLVRLVPRGQVGACQRRARLVRLVACPLSWPESHSWPLSGVGKRRGACMWSAPPSLRLDGQCASPMKRLRRTSTRPYFARIPSRPFSDEAARRSMPCPYLPIKRAAHSNRSHQLIHMCGIDVKRAGGRYRSLPLTRLPLPPLSRTLVKRKSEFQRERVSGEGALLHGLDGAGP